MSSQSASRHLWPWLWTLLGVAGLALLLVLNPNAREVARDTIAVLFAILTTPFILESTIAIVGLIVVLTYNQWRLKKDGDEWVYMVTQEDSGVSPTTGEKLPKAITQRLQGIVLKDKPVPLDESQAITGVIEGYLELGMPSQALDELHRTTDLPDTVASAILRFRVLGANLATEPALSLLRDAAERFPQSRPDLVIAAQDIARWIEKHMQSQAKAYSAWRNEADVIARLTVPHRTA
jgi:hypothetical protein